MTHSSHLTISLSSESRATRVQQSLGEESFGFAAEGIPYFSYIVFSFHISFLLRFHINQVTMSNDNLAMGYRRYGSEEQLVYDQDETDDDEIETEMEEAEQEEIEFEAEEHPHKHVYFVTDPHLSSWSYKDSDQETRTKLG